MAPRPSPPLTLHHIVRSCMCCPHCPIFARSILLWVVWSFAPAASGRLPSDIALLPPLQIHALRRLHSPLYYYSALWYLHSCCGSVALTPRASSFYLLPQFFRVHPCLALIAAYLPCPLFLPLNLPRAPSPTAYASLNLVRPSQDFLPRPHPSSLCLRAFPHLSPSLPPLIPLAAICLPRQRSGHCRRPSFGVPILVPHNPCFVQAVPFAPRGCCSLVGTALGRTTHLHASQPSVRRPVPPGQPHLSSAFPLTPPRH